MDINLSVQAIMLFQGEAEKNYKAILFESILKVITLKVKDLIHAIFDLPILY